MFVLKVDIMERNDVSFFFFFEVQRLLLTESKAEALRG